MTTPIKKISWNRWSNKENNTIPLRAFLFLLLAFLLQIPYSYTQPNLKVDYQTYITNRIGKIYGISAGYTLANTTVNIGATYNDIDGFRYGKNFARDGVTTSTGFGIQLSATRFINPENRKGLFWGIRGDLQFLEDTHASVFFSPPIILRSTAHLAVLQLGYQLDLKEIISIQFLISSGYSQHVELDKHLIVLTGIQLSKTINL